MKGTLFCYRPGQPYIREEITEVPSLARLQELVGGYIQVVPYFDWVFMDKKLQKCVAFCNEEGKLNGLEFNVAATMLWESSLSTQDMSLVRDGTLEDHLVGPIVIITGDDELLENI